MSTYEDQTQQQDITPAPVEFEAPEAGVSESAAPEGILATPGQAKLRRIANGSPQIKQLSAFRDMATNSAQLTATAQLKSIANASVSSPVQRKEGGSDTKSTPQSAPNTTGMPTSLKSGIERLSGMDISDVKVHYNSPKPAQLQAHAYAQGTDIHLGPGQARHLPHEAWHVVQQKQGRVKPTVQLKGKIAVNDDQGLEREADIMGAKAVAFHSKPVSKLTTSGHTSGLADHIIQRKIFLKNKDASDSKGAIAAIAAFRRLIADGSERHVSKGPRKHPVYKTLKRSAYSNRQTAIMNIIEGWMEDDVVINREFGTWDNVVQTANLQLMAQESTRGLNKEERRGITRKFAAIASAVSQGSGERVLDGDPDSKEEKKHAGMLGALTRTASNATDLLGFPKSLKDRLFFSVKRRKLHKSGVTNFNTDKIRYKTYQGTISPKPNAFVLGGSLAAEYGPLFAEVSKLIRMSFLAQNLKAPTDQAIAMLFLNEMSGKDAFAPFSKQIQIRAHKIIAIILFAELSRHSIALVSAAAAFHAIATSSGVASFPSLQNAFKTGSGQERALFAGSGGAELMRNRESKEMSQSEMITRRARGVVDILNFLKANTLQGEELQDVLKRKTLEYFFNLSQHTDETSIKSAKLTSFLYKQLTKVRGPKKSGDSPIVTITALGYTHHPQPGTANDCAIYSLYDQLTRRHNLVIPDRAAFVTHVRNGMNGPAGVMIDLVAQGRAMLNAARDYITNTLHLADIGISLHVWSATGDGSLMEFRNVASSNGGALPCVFYFNGVDHFDSLSGGLG